MIGNPVTLTNNVASKTLTVTATSGQTLFVIPGGYRINQISVFKNGIKLSSGQYQAGDGSTVVLTSGATLGEILEFQIFDDFKVANALDVNIGGNVGGGLSVSGVVTATSFIGNVTGNLAGNVTGNVSGNLTGNVTGNINSSGISTLGNVRISSGIVTAVSGVVTYYGDGQFLNLAGNPSAGVSSTTSVVTSGIVTASIVDGFFPDNSKIISSDTVINNGQENITLTEEIVVNEGVTLTVSAGSTVAANVYTPVRYNSTYGVLEIFDGTNWQVIQVTPYLPGLYSGATYGLFGGGITPAETNTIDYITIASTGNAIDFGDLTAARREFAACSSSTRGVFGGGSPGANTIDYITVASTGNAIDFGDLTVARSRLAACSSSTRGVFGGGVDTPGAANNTIDYITIASTGNATDFGDLTVARSQLAACSSSTRGVFGGGLSPAANNTIDYITIASTGNAIDFGDLTVARYDLAACSSSTRGVFGGGLTPTVTNTIDYITIASTGNAIDFGDLTVLRNYLAACSSSTRGVFGGGLAPTANNTIDYITIASTGNAIDFGDLTVAKLGLAACSNGHGGLS